MYTFIEAALLRPEAKTTLARATNWEDHSSSDYFIFSSDVGMVQLYKRTTYPRTFAYVDGTTLYFGYGDRQTARRAINQPLDSLPEATFYGEEFFLATVDSTNGDCIMQRDALCTMPLFVGHQDDRLVFSNKYDRAYQLLDPKKLTIHKAGLIILMMAENMSGLSLINEIEIFVDRARLTWEKYVYRKHRAPHGSIAHIAQHRNGEPKDLRKRLEYTLDQYWQRYATDNRVGAELSGGFDSSSVCGYYALQGKEFYPASLMYGDEASRVSAGKKLASFTKSFGVKSHEIAMDPASDYPLSAMVANREWRPFFPAETAYAPSLNKLAEYFATQGATVVFSGHGGDELYENIPQYEQRDLATPIFLQGITIPSYGTDKLREAVHTLSFSPVAYTVPLLAQSTTLGGVAGSNIYLDHGIWPVMPLADAQLYLYCQSLPIQYRANRDIMRAYLQARGFPDDISQRTHNEDFGSFFKEAARSGLTNIFKELMRDSIVAKMGFIDPVRAMRAWNEGISSNMPHKKDSLFGLWCVLIAEINLRILEADHTRA